MKIQEWTLLPGLCDGPCIGSGPALADTGPVPRSRAVIDDPNRNEALQNTLKKVRIHENR